MSYRGLPIYKYMDSQKTLLYKCFCFIMSLLAMTLVGGYCPKLSLLVLTVILRYYTISSVYPRSCFVQGAKVAHDKSLFGHVQLLIKPTSAQQPLLIIHPFQKTFLELPLPVLHSFVSHRDLHAFLGT